MKKLIALTLALVMVLSFLPVMAGAANEGLYVDKADILKDLGLFKGTSNGYELERVPTRMEASVMLVRLLGKETEVLAGSYAHPFTDVPEWADKYAGYMFEQGLTKGMSETIYGTDVDCAAKMYITFVLRALGFDDSARDFTYEDSIAFSKTIGLITEGYKSSLEVITFRRDDMAAISYAALLQSLSNSDTCLLEKLVTEGAVDSAKAAPYIGIYKYDNLIPKAQDKTYATNAIARTFTSVYSADGEDELKIESLDAIIMKSATDFDWIRSTLYYRGTTVVNERTSFYTNGYYYEVADGTKEKMTTNEFRGASEETLTEFSPEDIPEVTVVISPLFDSREPKNMSTDSNGNTVFTYVESGKTDAAKEEALTAVKNIIGAYNKTYTDEQYDNAVVTVSDISVTEKINSEGYYIYSNRSFTVTVYIDGEKAISMKYSYTTDIISAGKTFTIELPSTTGYKEI